MSVSARSAGAMALVACLAAGLSSEARAQIPPQERAALIALYDDTNGDSWTYNSGWKTPPLDVDGFALPGTECGWLGVSCVASRVESLALFSNGLSGSIPPALGDLAALVNLYLDDNQLTGSIPTELGSLASLQELYLDSNQLTGGIPPALGNLANLQVLYLRSNPPDTRSRDVNLLSRCEA